MEELQQRRAELLISTREEEGERARVSQDLAALQRRLAHLDASLERKRVRHVDGNCTLHCWGSWKVPGMHEASTDGTAPRSTAAAQAA